MEVHIEMCFIFFRKDHFEKMCGFVMCFKL